MPTYEYECPKCKKVVDVFQKMSDKPAANCPTCGKKMARLIGTGGGIIFKGSGFYHTDYKNKKKPGASGSCAKDKSDSCKGCSMNKGEA